jgi:hypothetical protein
MHKHGSHYPDNNVATDEVLHFQVSAHCKYCGKRLLQDSQGGWFESACNDKGEPQ